MQKDLLKSKCLIADVGLFAVGLLFIAANYALGTSAIDIKRVIAIIGFILSLYFIVRFYFTFRFRIPTIVLGLLFLLLVFLQINYLYQSLRLKHVGRIVVKILFVSFFQFVLLAVSVVPLIAHGIREGITPLYRSLGSKSVRLYLLSILLLAGVVLIYSPVTVFTSSWREFDITVLQLIFWLLLYFIIAFSIAYGLYRLVPEEIKILLIWGMFFAALSCWVYTYLLPGDYGLLDKLAFSEPDSLYNPVSWHLALEGIGLALGLILLITLLQKFPKQATVVMAILNLMALGQTLANVIFSGALQAVSIKQESKNGMDPPDYAADLLGFSREQNVIIIMTDMFCGGFMPGILEGNPELYSQFEGFTWYSNTLSTTNKTFGSLPPMVGGEPFSIENLESLDGNSLVENYNKAFQFFPDFFRSQDFSIAFSDLAYLHLTDLEQREGVILGKAKDFIPFWKKDIDAETLGDIVLSPAVYSRIFAVIGLFKGSPFLIKPKIYNKGYWLKTNSANEVIRHVVETLALMSVAGELSHADSSKKTFKFFSWEFTHSPWAIDNNGNISKEFVKSEPLFVDFPEWNRMSHNPIPPYNSWVKALKILGRWFSWMQTTGIYDNTRIIIVSDHGNYGIDPMTKDFIGILNNNGKEISGTARSHPLLLVKDFNQRGNLSISNQFMTNKDVSALATKGIAEEDPFVDPLRHDSDSRELVMNYISLKSGSHVKYTYQIEEQFKVRGSIFNKENWIDLMNGD